jgi:hypothetical protein
MPATPLKVDVVARRSPASGSEDVGAVIGGGTLAGRTGSDAA